MTALIIKEWITKVLLPFLWKFRWWFVVGVMLCIITFYKGSYDGEKEAHQKTIVDNLVSVEKMKAESATIIATERQKAIESYQALVVKTNDIQKRYNEREQDINTAVSTLSDSNNRLSQAVRAYTSTSGGKASNHTDAERLSTIGGLYETCQSEQDYFAREASKLGSSVLALKEWGEAVEESVNKDE